ncbi:TetR/AcrR family transcriptional regulator [Oricola sp.]|uniref:TetR/AcrR family transcriptional regulator n=1 Tax=Oricola sp. TaxID=1979950 RepID=UPI003BAA10FC
MNRTSVKTPRGRPREFDSDAAIEAALQLFWTKGFEATAISDVVAATGVNRASLYAAFGGKEDLFLKVLERYETNYGGTATAALYSTGNAKAVIQRFLDQSAAYLTDPGHPRGCLVSSTLAEAPHSAAAAMRKLTDSLARLETAIYNLLRSAQTKGGFAADADPRAWARHIVGVTQGMALVAKVNSDPTAVSDIARVTMTSWPDSAAGHG